MDPFRSATRNPATWDPATGKPDRHAAADGGAVLVTDARPKPDRYVNTVTDANKDAHARAHVEPIRDALKDADGYACANGGANNIAHSHADGVADARTNRVADTHGNANAHRRNVVPAQQPDATPGRHKLSARPSDGPRPAGGA